MTSSDSFLRTDWWIAGIEFAGALVIAAYVIRALVALVLPCARSVEVRIASARLLIADGVILGLSLKLAGTLLKTLALHSWERIAAFATILALRTILKRLFAHERTRAQATLQRAQLHTAEHASS